MLAHIMDFTPYQYIKQYINRNSTSNPIYLLHYIHTKHFEELFQSMHTYWYSSRSQIRIVFFVLYQLERGLSIDSILDETESWNRVKSMNEVVVLDVFYFQNSIHILQREPHSS